MDKDFRRDYRKMRFALLHLLLIVGGATGLKDLTINVPAMVRSGDTVTLSCHYDLEGLSLYTIQWFFNDNQFYSYRPEGNPPIKIFNIGIQVNDSESNTHDVTLMNVSRRLTGKYKCEVSADSTYHTLIATALMEVVDAPKTDPTIRTESERIEVGKILQVNCSSGNSQPAPAITWKLNGRPITEDNKEYNVQSYNISYDNETQSAKSMIQFRVTENHFSNGRLHLRCTASISGVYRKSADIEITEDKSRGRLASLTGVTSPRYGGVNGCAGQNWPWNGGMAIIIAIAAATLFLMMTSLTMTVPPITNVLPRNEPTVSR